MSKIICIIFLVSGIFASFPLTYFVYRKYEPRKRWIKHSGTVLDHVNDDGCYFVKYSYKYNDIAAEGKSGIGSSAYERIHPMGSQINIRINPYDLAMSDIDSSTYRYLTLIIFISGIIFASLGLFGLISGMKMDYE